MYPARLDLETSHGTPPRHAELAAALSIRYRLRAAGAVHPATAVSLAAGRFITNAGARRRLPAAGQE
jgi:hypothetical protein